MAQRSMIVHSRGTTYLNDFPVSPTLHPFSKPFLFIGLALPGGIVSFLPDSYFSYTGGTVIVAAYSCFYLLTIAIFSGLKAHRPPHRLYTFIINTLCTFIALCFIVTLLSAFDLITNPTITRYLYSSNILDIIVAFFVLNVPVILRRWSETFKQMVLEIEEGFRSQR